MRSSALLITALLGSTVSLPSHAQDASPARTLFKEGRDLASKGDYQAACPKFEQSLALEVGLGTQFNLADCWEHIGRNASAQQLFLGAAASAKAVGQLDREQVLRDRAAALEPRIVKLVVEVESTDPKLTVKRDDLPLETAQYGRALAVDPGSYVISAKAPGKKAWSQKIDVKPGQKVVTVSVPELEAAEPKPAALPPKAEPAKVAPAKSVTPPPASNTVDRDLNYPALGLAVLGASALTFGTYMGIRYKSANDEAKTVCPSSSGCTSDDISRHDDLVEKAKFNRAFSFVGFGAGVAAVTGSVLMFALEKPKKSTASNVQAAPALGVGYYGAALSGSF